MGQLAGPVMKLTLQNLEFGRNSVAVIGYRQCEICRHASAATIFS